MNKTLCRTVGVALALLLALLLPLGAWATSYHTITIDGTNDFDTSTERFATTSGVTLYAYATWDANYLYFGFSGSTPAGSVTDGNRVYHIYLDADPQATPTSGNGTTDGETWRWDPTLPFNADYHYAFKTQDNSEYKRSYSGSAWGDATIATSNWKGSGFWEMRMARADLGAPDAVYVVMYVEEDWAGGSISGGAPGDLFTNTSTQGAITFNAHWLGFVLSSGIDPNHADNADCNPDITVTSTADSGAGSLRQALADVCPGGSITFNGDISITLASELSINKHLTVDGGSHAVTVSGDEAVRVFKVTGSVSVTLDSLRIVHGADRSSECGGNSCGGGLYVGAGAAVTLTHSLVFSNTAGLGGGIYTTGTLVVQNSTLYDNAAALGGGILNEAASVLTIQHSTLYSNLTAFGGGGGILNAGLLNLENTLIANSTGPDCTNSGVLGTNTHNLVEDATCDADFSGDPQLDVLGDYGGGTETVPLRTNSPAIDAGDSDACLPTDQRGFPRADLRCDIGAFERQFDDNDGDTVVKTGFTGGVPYSFGPTMISMTLAAGDTGSVTITKHLAAPGGIWNEGEISVTWWITHDLVAGLPVTVSFCYADTEIGDAQEWGLTPFRWNGSDWEEFTGSVEIDFVNHCVTAQGVSTFSPWTLFDTSGTPQEPTAARVVGLTARGFAPVAALPVPVGAYPVLVGALALGGAVVFRRRRQ